MKILKKRFPGSVINPSAKGLIARALHDQARADQQATGKDYSSAWYDLVDRLATDQTVEKNAEQEGDLRSWIYSLPLEALKKTLTEEQTVVFQVPDAGVEEVFASLADFPPGDALAAYLAQLAVAAYQDREVLEPLLISEGATNFSWFEKSGSAAFGCVLHGHPVIAFRGTNSLRYAVVDLLILPWGIPIRHFGFNLAWRRVRKQVLCWLDSLDTVKGIVFTGHSLGGAMAFFAAEELSQYTVDAVVTFGAPRPGMHGFAYKYNNMRCGRMPGGARKSLYRVTRRYTNDTDVISRVPPPPLYKHVGGLVRSLGKDGKIEEETPGSFFRRLCFQGNDLFLRVLNFRYGLFLGGEEKDVDVRLTSIIFSFVKCFGPVAWLAGFFASFFGILFIPMAMYDFLCHPSGGYIRSFFINGRYQALALPWAFLNEE